MKDVDNERLYKLYVNTFSIRRKKCCIVHCYCCNHLDRETLTCTAEDKNETHSSRNGDVVKTR